VVEFELAVGKALATTEDPDYDTDNMLYTGEQNIMIRPYPLPSSVKVKVRSAYHALYFASPVLLSRSSLRLSCTYLSTRNPLPGRDAHRGRKGVFSITS